MVQGRVQRRGAFAENGRSGCLTTLSLLGVFIGLLFITGPSVTRLWGVVFMFAGSAYLIAPLLTRQRRRRAHSTALGRQPDAQLSSSDRPLELLHEITTSYRGGVFLGLGPVQREWITADPQHAVLVLGPPRSGKTSAVMIPAVLSAVGPVVSTSTKLDVMYATAPCRSVRGRIWLFDPSGEEPVPPGVRQLRWSPLASRGSWDDALTVSRAMVDAADVGTGADSAYWNERAGALLAGLLRAAAVSDRSIEDVRGWVLREELDLPMASLEIRGEQLALDVLDGVSRTSEHTRSGIFSTASSVLSAYNSAGALRVCANPNFDVNAFVRSHDTVYISAPAHQQTRLAPLVVGLLEQIRNATYARARDGHLGTPPLLWALDEVANIAPLRALPSLVSEGGGQGLQVIACFQDLAQARARWGAAADGFISLFGTKLVFGGIGDLETLRALSAFVGNWDRPYSSVSTSRSKTRHRSDPVFFGASRTSGVSVTNWVQREAILSEGDIATVPRGRALMLRAGWWGLVSIEPYFVSPCWRNVLAHAPHAIVQH